MWTVTPGTIVICATGQAGTIEWISGNTASVLLRNNDVWCGPLSQCREPQDQADLDACPIDVPRPETKIKKRS